MSEEVSMFEKASRLKIRFSYKGLCTVEDLWDLPLTVLDRLHSELSTSLKATQEGSLLEIKTSKNEELELQIELIKYVVSVRLKETKERESARDRAMQKEKLFRLIAQKQDEGLQAKSIEELQAMVEQLD